MDTPQPKSNAMHSAKRWECHQYHRARRGKSHLRSLQQKLGRGWAERWVSSCCSVQLHRFQPRRNPPSTFLNTQSVSSAIQLVSADSHYLRSSTGYIAVHEDNVAGPLLGYLNAHRLVQKSTSALEYKYKTTSSMMEINAVVSLTPLWNGF